MCATIYNIFVAHILYIGKEKKIMTKRQRDIVDSFERSNMTELYHAYHSASAKKMKAWENCKRIYAEHATRIIGANSFQFSAGFEFTAPTTGEVRFCYITKNGVEEWDE